MRVIITGGTGLIGRPLSAALAAEGHQVTVLSRNPIEVKNPLPTGVNLHRWDAKTSEGWGDLVNGADAIVNLAGAGIADGRWSAERKKLIRESRIRAGHAIVEAVRAADEKPKVVVQSSAVGYYGTETGDQEVTEEFSPGSDFLSKVCFDWEISTAPISRMGIRRPIARTGIVLSNFGGAFPKLKIPFSMFAGGKLGDGSQWMPWIHIADEVKALYFLLTNEEADGPFNLTAPNPVRNAEIAKALGDAMGRPSAIPAPGFAMKAALGEMALMLLEGQRAVPKRLEELGFTWKYPTIEEALGQLVGRDEATPAEPVAA